MNGRAKPQGSSGAVSIGSGGVAFHKIEFPPEKADRENLIAELFVQSFDRWVAGESEPSLKPFDNLVQNQENDLDFTVSTSDGERLLELVEFAPLKEYGPKFSDSPNSIDTREKSSLAFCAIKKKSDHQGGNKRILLVYCTEHAFWLDPITIERIRRLLAEAPPKFDRVYYISVHDLESASVSEIFPGTPHHTFGGMTDAQIDGMGVHLPHPKDMVARQGVELSRARPNSVYRLSLPYRLELMASCATRAIACAIV